MTHQKMVTLNAELSPAERLAALADSLDRAIEEADALGLGVIAIRIAMARDLIDLDTNFTPTSAVD